MRICKPFFRCGGQSAGCGFRFLSLLATVLWLGAAVHLRAQDQEPAPAELFQLAAELEAAEQWAEAAEVYAELLELVPDSQRATVSLGVCLYNDGQVVPAIPTLQDGIALDEYTWWAEKGLYNLAAAQQELGQDDAAFEAIDALSVTFPDSPYYAQAEVIAAQIDGVPTVDAEVAAFDAFTAFYDYRDALREDDGAEAAVCMELLEAVTAEHPGSGAAYRALESIGFLHARNKRSAEYLAAFEQILDEVAEAWPQSRLVANAKLQKAGAFFETLMLPGDYLALVPPEEWEQARALCEEVIQLEQASPLQIARAKLMIIETCHWQQCFAQALEGAQAYIEEYDPAQFRQEVATAHQIAGEVLHIQRQHEAAMVHFQWIIDEYPIDEEIWPGLHNLARAYYWVFSILYLTRAPLDQVLDAGYTVLENFPGTSSAELVQNALEFIEERGWPIP